MILTYNPVRNNSTTNVNQVILTEITTLPPIEAISSITYSFDPLESPTDLHIVEYRWSTDGNLFSPWFPLPSTTNDFQILSNVLRDKALPITFNFRFTRSVSSNVTLSLNELNVEYTEQIIEKEDCCLDEASTSCPTLPNGEIGQCSLTNNSCAGITVKCDSQLFMPEKFAKAMACAYEQQANVVGEMFGWTVYYFKVEPDLSSKDVILHEYTLHNVVDTKMMKVIVPDNEFPSEELQFNGFDMDFADDFEVQIMRDHFHNTFGVNARPKQRDYLYFPLQDRLWEVHSVFAAKADFMQTSVYWKVKLFKWQDKVNVNRDDDTNTFIDNLTTNFDEMFEEEVNDEFDRVTHPIQYTPISIGKGDHIRDKISEDLDIYSLELNNYFTNIAKYKYDLTSITPYNQPVLWYKETLNYQSNENLAISFWFNIQSFDNESIMISSYNIDGIDVKFVYLNNLVDRIEVRLNGVLQVFSGLPVLELDNWYGFVLNISNEYLSGDLHLWKIQYDPNNVNTFTTKLELLFSEVFNLTPNSYDNGEQWKLYSGPHYITNIRLWKAPIPEEKQSLILNSYIVRQSNLLRMADNALKPMVTNKSSFR